MLMRRLSRSSEAPAGFYVVLAIGFVALTVWAVIQGEFVIAAIAAVMIAATALGSKFVRRAARWSAMREVDDEQ